MNTQPEALRLADELDKAIFPEPYLIGKATDELRRLHERNEDLLNRLFRLDLLNEDLVEALESMVFDFNNGDLNQGEADAISKAHAALAKAQGKTK